jgi:hypothetical protein
MYCKEMDGKVSLFFGMHKQDLGKKEGIINQNNYPLQDIIDEYKSSYFTNTISYMLAMAIHQGYEVIEMFGVDMDGREEYYNQKGSVMYWVGYARAKGIKVRLASNIDKPSFLYGYDDTSAFKKKLESIEKAARKEKDKTKENNIRQQYVGFLHAMSVVKREL